MNSRSTGDLRKVYRYSENITRSRDHILMMQWTEQNRGTTIDKSRNSRIESLRVRVNRLSLMRHDEIMRIYSNVVLSRNISPLPRRRRRRTRSTKSRRRRRRPDTAPQNRLLVRIRPLTPDQPESSPTASPELEAETRSRSRSISPTLASISIPSPRPELVPLPRTRSPTPQLKVKHIVIEPEKTVIDMIPISFKPSQKPDDDGKEKDDDDYEEREEEDDDDDDDDAEEDEQHGIIYPDGVIDRQPYKIVARYRRAMNQSTNFCAKPLHVADDSTETLILGLESFAQQHGCDLRFTGENQQFDKSIYRAACGVIDLGSVHLLATDSLLTANFQFEIDLDYESEITQSKDNVEKFVVDFCQAISQVLFCDKNNVRVFSIDKLTKKSGRSHVNFGLTTPDQKKTEQLARNLQAYARSGFATDTILKYVKPGEYECAWKPVLKYLRIQTSDLDSRYNFDYRKPGVIAEDTRGGLPYYLPLGWYRFGLNVETKYKDGVIWLGCINAKGEWPVAFHGTRADAVSGIVQHGFLPSAAKKDAMMEEAIDQIGEEANRPGIYVATHCNGGSDIYTQPFTVTAFPGKSERFRIVFQCRVEPGKFTTHTSPVNVGEAWRIVDPNAIRPYGILLKKEG